MALATYSDLSTAVPKWMARPGDTNIMSNIADFVTLCEERIHYGAPEGSAFATRPLRVRGLETSRALVIDAPTSCGIATGSANAITLTPSTAVASLTAGLLLSFTALASNTGATTINVSGLGATSVVIGADSLALTGGEITGGATHQAYYDSTNFVLLPDNSSCPLPSGFIGARAFYIPASPRQYLSYITPDIFNETMKEDSDTGQPERYTIEAEALRFDPQPDTTYYPFMLYYKKLPPLVTNSTNWLMTNAPAIYLYGTLLEASLYIGSEVGIQKWGPSYQAACDGLVAADVFDRHSGGVLVMRNLSGNP